MKTLFVKLRRRTLGLSPKSVSFKQRGFRGASAPICQRLETVGTAFLSGYHFALESVSTPELETRLDGIELELRGFAFEGAAMGLALLERLTPWPSRRLAEFLSGPGGQHAYMIHVGIGWIWARAPF